jgi:hypothetical protein
MNEVKIVKAEKYHVYNIKAHNVPFPIRIQILSKIIISLFILALDLLLFWVSFVCRLLAFFDVHSKENENIRIDCFSTLHYHLTLLSCSLHKRIIPM